MTITTTDLDTPVGTLRIAARTSPRAAQETVVACCFTDHWDRMAAPARQRFAGDEWREGPSQAADALARYLAGDLDAVTPLAVDGGGTDFQARVWDALRAIPVGETRSYADIARVLGSPTATRAVGAANGRNPVWVVVPCHRVIRTDWALGGYGGGLDRKRWLLAHEEQSR